MKEQIIIRIYLTKLLRSQIFDDDFKNNVHKIYNESMEIIKNLIYFFLFLFFFFFFFLKKFLHENAMFAYFIQNFFPNKNVNSWNKYTKLYFYFKNYKIKRKKCHNMKFNDRWKNAIDNYLIEHYEQIWFFDLKESHIFNSVLSRLS